MDMDDLNGRTLKSELDFVEKAHKRFHNRPKTQLDNWAVNLRTEDGLPDLEIFGNSRDDGTVTHTQIGELWSFAGVKTEVDEDLDPAVFYESIRQAVNNEEIPA